jgi:hypothetical protein
LGNAEFDEIDGLPKVAAEGVVGEEPAEEVDDRLAVAADKELEGPKSWFVADPPATRPEEPPVAVAPVRMYRWRRSRGFF